MISKSKSKSKSISPKLGRTHQKTIILIVWLSTSMLMGLYFKNLFNSNQVHWELEINSAFDEMEYKFNDYITTTVSTFDIMCRSLELTNIINAEPNSSNYMMYSRQLEQLFMNNSLYYYDSKKETLFDGKKEQKIDAIKGYEDMENIFYACNNSEVDEKI